MSSNANIDKKTTFSRAKLQKRKEVKYSRILTPVEPTSRAVCEYYFEQKPMNTRYMRMDTLAQMLTLGNVGPGWKGIVVDECGGLLLGAVMERMGGVGQVLAIHVGDQVQQSILNLMNDVQGGVELLNLPWNRFRRPSAANGTSEAPTEVPQALNLNPDPETETGAEVAAVEGEDSVMDTTEDQEDVNGEEEPNGDAEPNDGDRSEPKDGEEEPVEANEEEEEPAADGENGNGSASAPEEAPPAKKPKELEGSDQPKRDVKDDTKKTKKTLLKERKQRRTARNATIAVVLEQLHRGGFMSLLCASSSHPTSLLATLTPYLAGSATFAVYNPLKEPLPDTYLWLRGSGMPFINVQLTETMMREWQAKKGRMHPEMMTSGTGGFILSGIKVIMNPDPPASFLKKLSDKEENKRKKAGAGRKGVTDSPAPSEAVSDLSAMENVNED